MKRIFCFFMLIFSVCFIASGIESSMRPDPDSLPKFEVIGGTIKVKGLFSKKAYLVTENENEVLELFVISPEIVPMKNKGESKVPLKTKNNVDLKKKHPPRHDAPESNAPKPSEPKPDVPRHDEPNHNSPHKEPRFVSQEDLIRLKGRKVRLTGMRSKDTFSVIEINE